jgi:hypothetical protein
MAEAAAKPRDAFPAGYSSSNLSTFAQGIVWIMAAIYVGVVL